MTPLFEHFENGCTGSGQDPFYSDPIEGRFLLRNGDGIVAEYSGICSRESPTAKTLRILFAGHTIFESDVLADIWWIKTKITRVNERELYCLTRSSLPKPLQKEELLAINLHESRDLQLIGQAITGGGCNQIVAKLGRGWTEPAVWLFK